MHDLQLLQRPPWALLFAILLVLVAEVGLRSVRSSGVVPFESGEGEYRSLVVELWRIGAPEVVVIGSSRAREAILGKELGKRLKGRFGCAPKVGNYALPGGHAQEAGLALQRILDASPGPSLVLYGVGPRQLLAKPRPLVNSAYLWTPAQWLDARRRWGKAADPYLGQVVRTALSRHSWLVRYAPEAHAALHITSDDLTRSDPTWSAGISRLWRPKSRSRYDPKRGHTTSWNRLKPEAHRNVSPKRTREYLAKVLGEGRTYALDAWQVTQLEESVERLMAAGVPVVLFGVPMSQAMRDVIPPHIEPDFLALMEGLSERYGVPWLPESTLSGPLPAHMFREQSHVNLAGAVRWTDHLARSLPAGLMSRALPQCHELAPSSPNGYPPTELP